MIVQKVIYWIATILLCGIMLFSAGMYFTKTEMIQGFFESFNYPSYIVIPLATAKILAVIMILWRKSSWLTEWAYAGLFFDMVLAATAHITADDGGATLALLGLLFLVLSYFFGKVVRY